MQKVNLFQPVINTQVGTPLVIRAGITTSAGNTAGMVQASQRIETYVLLSALPDELRERVRTAIEMLSMG